MQKHILWILLLSLCGTAMQQSDNTGQRLYQDTNSSIKIVLFDLNGVLLDTSKRGITKEIIRLLGLGGMARFTMRALFSKQHPREEIFSFMEEVGGYQGRSDNEYFATDPQGRPLPALMCNWLAGLPYHNSGHILAFLYEKIDAAYYDKTQKRIMKHLARAIFDPAIRAAHTHTLKPGYRLLRYVQDRYPDCTYAILSNYDTTCFLKTYEKPELAKVFKRFNPKDTHISADLRMIKPHPQIYWYICEYYNVNPSECLFIDDEIENVKAAREIGMNAIHFNQRRTKHIYPAINELLTR